NRRSELSPLSPLSGERARRTVSVADASLAASVGPSPHDEIARTRRRPPVSRRASLASPSSLKAERAGVRRGAVRVAYASTARAVVTRDRSAAPEAHFDFH